MIFEMQLINDALFLNARLLFLIASSGSATKIFLFTTIYASPKSHKSDFSNGVSIQFQFFCGHPFD